MDSGDDDPSGFDDGLIDDELDDMEDMLDGIEDDDDGLDGFISDNLDGFFARGIGGFDIGYDAPAIPAGMRQYFGNYSKTREFDGNFDESDASDEEAWINLGEPTNTSEVTMETTAVPTSPLHVACAVGDINSVKKILASIPASCIDLCDPSSRESPMEIACVKGHEEVVSLLVSHGAQGKPLIRAIQSGNAKAVQLVLDGTNINSANTQGYTPLHYAADLGHAEIASLLLQKGANPSAQLKKNPCTSYQPIHMSAARGHAEVVKLLLQHGVRANARTSEGSTPLLLAVSCGNLEVVNVLLSKGADVEAMNRYRETPLVTAVKLGHADIVRKLLQKGADVSVKDKGESLFTIACTSNMDVLKEMLKYGAPDASNNDIFMRAIELGKTDIVEWLLSQRKQKKSPYVGFSPQAGDEITAMSIACRRGHLELVKMLVNRGMDVNATLQTRSMLVCACESDKDDVEVLKYLLEAGAQVTTKKTRNPFIHTLPSLIEREQDSGLAAAVIRGHPNKTKLLLERGAEKDIKLLPLAASLEDNDEILKTLYEHGLTPTGRFGSNWTLQALYKAINVLNVKGLKFLLENYVSEKELKASTALHTLTMTRGSAKKKIAIGKLLIQHGSPLDFRSHNGATPLYLAVRTNSIDLTWLYTTSGANLELVYDDGNIIWDYNGSNKKITEALYHVWSPRTHRYHPTAVQQAIKCMLLIAKRQKWSFGEDIMHKILGFVAFDWALYGIPRPDPTHPHVTTRNRLYYNNIPTPTEQVPLQPAKKVKRAAEKVLLEKAAVPKKKTTKKEQKKKTPPPKKKPKK